MEMNKMIYILICGAITLVGAIETVYQIYQITILDAATRGLKRPKLWGMLSISGNNSSGLLLYLIGRRKFPIINITVHEQQQIASRKKAAGVGLLFLAIGSIGCILSIVLF